MISSSRRVNLAGGIVGGVHDDGLGVFVEGGAEFAFVEGPFFGCRRRRAKLHETWFRSAEDRIGAVVFVVRFENDDLIAGIADGEQGGDHRLGGAAAHGNLGFRIDSQTLERLHLLRNRGTQAFRAPGNGVLIHVSGDGFLGGLLDLSGSGKIGKTLRQIDRVVQHRLASHLANDRFGEVGNLVAEEMLGLELERSHA